MQNHYDAGPPETGDDLGARTSGAIGLPALLKGSLRRWKLIAVVTALSLFASFGLAKLLPLRYKSTVEILIYDPQRQIDSAVQKPISPFVDAIGYDAINTEISILKSKSIALRVVRQLGLDKDLEVQGRSKVSDFLGRLGLPYPKSLLGADQPPATEAERLDQAADTLLADVEAWPNSYIITVSATSSEPAKAQLIAHTIATDYLTSQREARQEALEHVAGWLKDRVDTMRSRVLQTEAAIQRLKIENGIRDTESSDSVRAQQVSELNIRLMTSREEVSQKRARLEQARRIIDSNGDIQSIPELTASSTLTALRQKQIELSSRTDELQSRLGDNHQQVVASRAALAAVNKQISMETAHILGGLQNDYDIAALKAQSLEAGLERLTTQIPRETYSKLQQLRALAVADHGLYESYLSQYNDISERRTLQNASARIISPATLPRRPLSSKRKLVYAVGGALGMGGSTLLSLFLEYRKRGFKTRQELESSFGRPVLGAIPFIRREKALRSRANRALAPKHHAYLNEAVYGLRISLELLSASPKVVLVTSALPSEGKSTAARLLAASSAAAGRRTVLLDCDLHHQRPASGAPAPDHQPGLSEVLRSKAELSQAIVIDPAANHHVIRAGSLVPNPADWLLSQRMREVVALLRNEFDYVVMDAPPVLPVVDALALATLADKIVLIVAWADTPRPDVSEALKILRPESHRVAGIVLNKVDSEAMPGQMYGRYSYPAIVGKS